MKTTLATLTLLISISSFAKPSALEGVKSTGQAQLPSHMQFVEEGRRVVNYSTAELAHDFIMYDDNTFELGQVTSCVRRLGKTARDLSIPVVLKERFKDIGWSQDFSEFLKKTVGKTGKATILIPKGSNVFGDCSGQNIKFLSIHRADPKTGLNSFEHVYKVIYSK